jgi:hypothetical protein
MDQRLSGGVMSRSADSLPQICFDITEASRILRMSRAILYERVRLGEIKTQKDGRRSYITAEELRRYVTSKG